MTKMTLNGLSMKMESYHHHGNYGSLSGMKADISHIQNRGTACLEIGTICGCVGADR